MDLIEKYTRQNKSELTESPAHNSTLAIEDGILDRQILKVKK